MKEFNFKRIMICFDWAKDWIWLDEVGYRIWLGLATINHDAGRVLHINIIPLSLFICLRKRNYIGAKPSDCSSDPNNCPDNEGYGCHCSLIGE